MKTNSQIITLFICILSFFTNLTESVPIRLTNKGKCLKITPTSTLSFETECETLKSLWFLTTNGHIKSASTGECISSDLHLSVDCKISKNLWHCEKGAESGKLKSVETGKYINNKLQMGESSKAVLFKAYNPHDLSTTNLCEVQTHQEPSDNDHSIKTTSGKECIFPFSHASDPALIYQSCLATSNANVFHCAVDGDIYDPKNAKTFGHCDLVYRGVLSDWTLETKCSVSCGGGKLQRHRTCLFHPCRKNGKDWVDVKRFDGSDVHCNMDACNIDDFKPLDSNDPDERPCVFPYLRNGEVKNSCFQVQKSGTEEFRCSTTYDFNRDGLGGVCPMEFKGVWGKWEIQDSCSRLCGGGSVFRQRRCYIPPCQRFSFRHLEVRHENILVNPIHSAGEFISRKNVEKACLENPICTGFSKIHDKFILSSGQAFKHHKDSVGFYYGPVDLERDKVSSCNDGPCDNCFEEIGEGFSGEIAVTYLEEKCLDWELVDADLVQANKNILHSNFCRNPKGSKKMPWCYTSLDKNWRYCKIQKCDASEFSILAVEGNAAGTECSFPFEFEGVTFHGCYQDYTSSDQNGKFLSYCKNSNGIIGQCAPYQTGLTTNFDSEYKSCSANCGGGFKILKKWCLVPPCDILDLYKIDTSQSCNVDPCFQDFEGETTIENPTFSGIISYTLNPGKKFTSVNENHLLTIEQATVECHKLGCHGYSCHGDVCKLAKSKTLTENDDKISYLPRKGDCFHGNGEFYEGNFYKTVSGKTCADWKSLESKTAGHFPGGLGVQYLEELGENYFLNNFCRNPMGARDAPFCLIEEDNMVLWEYCDIPKCISFDKFKLSAVSPFPHKMPETKDISIGCQTVCSKTDNIVTCNEGKLVCPVQWKNLGFTSEYIHSGCTKPCGTGKTIYTRNCIYPGCEKNKISAGINKGTQVELKIEREPCNEVLCDNCYYDHGFEYVGTVSKQWTGDTCVKWNRMQDEIYYFWTSLNQAWWEWTHVNIKSFFGELLGESHNNCRIPRTGNANFKRPGCINEDYVWRYCDVQKCEGLIDSLESVVPNADAATTSKDGVVQDGGTPCLMYYHYSALRTPQTRFLTKIQLLIRRNNIFSHFIARCHGWSNPTWDYNVYFGCTFRDFEHIKSYYYHDILDNQQGWCSVDLAPYLESTGIDMSDWGHDYTYGVCGKGNKNVWSNWIKSENDCSKTCGGGKWTYHRFCLSPPCRGSFFKEFGDCNVQPCIKKKIELENCFHGKGTRFDKPVGYVNDKGIDCCEDWAKSPFKFSLEHLKGWNLEKNYCRNVPIDGRMMPWCWLKQTEECRWVNYGLKSERRIMNWRYCENIPKCTKDDHEVYAIPRNWWLGSDLILCSQTKGYTVHRKFLSQSEHNYHGCYSHNREEFPHGALCRPDDDKSDSENHLQFRPPDAVNDAICMKAYLLDAGNNIVRKIYRYKKDIYCDKKCGGGVMVRQKCVYYSYPQGWRGTFGIR